MRPYRKEKLASVVRHIVGEAIVHRLNDPRITPLTTVTRVEMTGDLQIARVYLSVHGGDAAERRTLTALRHAGGYLQRLVAGGLEIRQCPALRFEIDKGAKGARRTLQLLAENRQREPELIEQADQDDAEHPSAGDGPGAAAQAEGGSSSTAEGRAE